MRVLLLAMILDVSLCEYDRRVITTLMHSDYRVVPVIVNGNPAVKGQVPYLVSIKEIGGSLGKSRIIWKNLCGGSILSPKKVITAAHCFELNHFYYAHHTEQLRVVAGNLKNDLTHSGATVTSEHSQWRGIKKLLMHPYFVFPQNDIALVFVDKPWIFSKSISYIEPANILTDYPPNCHSAGFGMTDHTSKNSFSPVMLVAQIEPMSRFKCNVLWGLNMNNFICSHSLVSDVGMGDSGGPLECQGTADPAERSGKLLVGVVSGKNFDKTTIYTRVSQYIEWIESDGKHGANSCGVMQLGLNLLFIICLGLLSFLLFLF